MRHPSSPDHTPDHSTDTPPTGSPFVPVGQKDVYDPDNAADHAEYEIVRSYARY